MAHQVQQVFKTALKVTGPARSMSTGVMGSIDVNAPPKRSQSIHLSVQRDYPAAAALPLPANIDPTETTRFSPQRTRDINSTAILTHQSSYVANHIDVTVDSSSWADPHVDSYDCRGAVSLNSAMQSNVPSPFGGMHKFTHLNMPGGGWAQEGKFLAQDLQASHYMNLRKEVRSDWSSYGGDRKPQKEGTFGLLERYNKLMLKQTLAGFNSNPNGNIRHFSLNHAALAQEIPKNATKQSIEEQASGTTAESSPASSEAPLTRKEQLKKAVKEYGSTVIVFHVGISLVSLGACYVLVSSGIDMVALLERFGWGDSALASKAGAGASTFVIAYAIHKVFAPVRISITLGATPFIVRVMRKRFGKK